MHVDAWVGQWGHCILSMGHHMSRGHNTCSTHTPGHSAQLMRPGIGRNVPCAMSNWLTSSPGDCSQPRESWFSDTWYSHA